MIFTILKLRVLQFWRLLKTVGWLLLLIALPLLGILFLRLLEVVQNTSDYTLAAVFVLSLIFLHQQRKDIGFLRKLDIAKWRVFLAEYNALVLPLSLLFLILFQKWLALLLIHLGVSLVAFLPQISGRKKQGVSFSLSFIPTEAFELKAGIRKYWPLLTLAYVPGILLAHFIGAALVSVLVFALVAVSFYDEFESRQLVEQFYFQPNWLWQKSWVQAKVYLGLHLPQIVLFLFFHTQYWYILLAALVVGLMIIFFALYYKYASFVPKRTRVYNQTAFGFYLIGFIIPFFFPASLFYLILYYRRARQRMDYFYKQQD